VRGFEGLDVGDTTRVRLVAVDPRQGRPTRKRTAWGNSAGVGPASTASSDHGQRPHSRDPHTRMVPGSGHAPPRLRLRRQARRSRGSRAIAVHYSVPVGRTSPLRPSRVYR
jgi:hypothetical protein